MNGGKTIVLTAPLTEMIDHAGYFIQMQKAESSIGRARSWSRPAPSSSLRSARASGST